MNEASELPREVRTFYEITQAINASTNQQEVLPTILERTVKELGYRAATLRLLDEERQKLELRAAYGLSEAYLTKGPVAVTRSVIDQKVMSGERVAISDVRHDPGFEYPEAAVREGLSSMLAVPLAVRERVMGVLHVYTDEPHTFTPEEQALLSGVANIAAQILQRVYLYEAFQKLAHDLNSTLELKEVLTTLLVEVVHELNVKAGSLRLLGPRRMTLHLAAAYGLSETYLKKGSVLVAQSPIDRRVLDDGIPVVVTELDGSFQYPEEARQEGIRSVLVVCLCVRDTPVGILRLYSGQIRRFSTEEISFARTVADLGAVALENAKLHEALKERLAALKENADGWYRFLAFG